MKLGVASAAPSSPSLYEADTLPAPPPDFELPEFAIPTLPAPPLFRDLEEVSP